MPYQTPKFYYARAPFCRGAALPDATCALADSPTEGAPSYIASSPADGRAAKFDATGKHRRRPRRRSLARCRIRRPQRRHTPEAHAGRPAATVEGVGRFRKVGCGAIGDTCASACWGPALRASSPPEMDQAAGGRRSASRAWRTRVVAARPVDTRYTRSRLRCSAPSPRGNSRACRCLAVGLRRDGHHAHALVGVSGYIMSASGIVSEDTAGRRARRP